MRRLAHLQHLNLSNNPLSHNQLRLLQSLTSLQSLNLSATGRTATNLPSSLDNLTQLTELDLSGNQLAQVPELVYNLKTLKRLNLSDNCFHSLLDDLDVCWPKLEVLNLSRNELRSLPVSLSKLEGLRCLYLNYNQLNFEGLPKDIGKLFNLEVFMATDNQLELMPESLFRGCAKLKKLVLANNKLITLPDAFHLLQELKVLDLANNPELILPPKPSELMDQVESKSIRNIDATLANQLKKATSLTGDGQCLTGSLSEFSEVFLFKEHKSSVLFHVSREYTKRFDCT